MPAQSKALTWTGRIISYLVVAMLLFSAAMKFSQSKEVMDGFTNQFGWPAKLIVPIGIIEVCCAILYLIPRTAVLGAVLLTGYLGGAIVTHLRVQDPSFIGALIVGIVMWFGLFFQDPRIRALLPLRRAA